MAATREYLARWHEAAATAYAESGRFSDGEARRFWAKVDRSERAGCWVWQGATTSTGYGLFDAGGKLRPAHRVGFELEYGPPPDGRHLHHECRNAGCVRPDHLTPMAPAEHHAHHGRDRRKKRSPVPS